MGSGAFKGLKLSQKKNKNQPKINKYNKVNINI